MKKITNLRNTYRNIGKIPGKDQPQDHVNIINIAITQTLIFATQWEQISELDTNEDVILQTSSGRMFRGYKGIDCYWEFDGSNVGADFGSPYVRCIDQDIISFRQIEFE